MRLKSSFNKCSDVDLNHDVAGFKLVLNLSAVKRWRMCFSYKSFTFICFHANFSSFSFVDRQNTYSCKSDLFAT